MHTLRAEVKSCKIQVEGSFINRVIFPNTPKTHWALESPLNSLPHLLVLP